MDLQGLHQGHVPLEGSQGSSVCFLARLVYLHRFLRDPGGVSPQTRQQAKLRAAARRPPGRDLSYDVVLRLHFREPDAEEWFRRATLCGRISLSWKEARTRHRALCNHYCLFLNIKTRGKHRGAYTGAMFAFVGPVVTAISSEKGRRRRGSRVVLYYERCAEGIPRHV